jgi:hypothetical protein
MSDAARLDHVAIALPRAADAMPWLVGELGGMPTSAGPGPGFRFWQLAFARGGLIEVLEPDDTPDGFLRRFLAARGTGIHHLTFKVTDLRAGIERAARLGYPVVGVSELHPAWKEAFLHPKLAQGIVVQLAESHPELEPRTGRAGISTAPEPARARGHSQRALAQASQPRAPPVAGAARRAVRRGRTRARVPWPDSPLAITVEIDASAPPGPLGIEIATPRVLRFADGDDRALGTRWLRAGGPR